MFEAHFTTRPPLLPMNTNLGRRLSMKRMTTTTILAKLAATKKLLRKCKPFQLHVISFCQISVPIPGLHKEVGSLIH